MNLTQIETAARNKYNSVGSNFYSSAEILDLIYEASLELATEALIIEDVQTSSTVAGTQTYSFPTRAIAFKRVTYDGNKLSKIDFTLDDQLTLNNATTTEQGTPQYYYLWEGQVYLRPIPDSVKTLAMYTYKEPKPVEAGDTLEIPSMFHMDIVNYVVSEMCAKDENPNMATYYFNKWERGKKKAVAWRRRRDVADSFKVVKDEESMATNILGPV